MGTMDTDKDSLHSMEEDLIDMECADQPLAAPARACPKYRVIYRIHPAIGIARVGSSPTQFFIGPERMSDTLPTEFYELEPLPAGHPPASAPPPRAVTPIASVGTTRFREVGTEYIRRQAARFRIFEYKISLATNQVIRGGIRELKADDFAKITWTVHLANKKAKFYNFNGPNWDAGKRDDNHSFNHSILEPAKMEIDSEIDTVNNAKTFHIAPVNGIDTLGHAYRTDAGHLVVLGGYGISDGPAPTLGTRFTYANNPGWNDDVSDGPITATFTLKGQTDPVKPADILGAWVVVGPPDFAPELVNVVSLYDTLLDVAVRRLKPRGHDLAIYQRHGISNRYKKQFRPHFKYDILRLFQGTKDSATVFLPAATHAMHPKLFALAENTSLDDYGTKEQREKNRTWRNKVLNTIRKPGRRTRIPKSDPDLRRDPAGNLIKSREQVYAGTMPMLYGDDVAEYYQVTRFAITETLYRSLQSWARGEFRDIKETKFSEIHFPSSITPWGLDRTALERCVGGPFFPGIEASWLVTQPSLYLEPFRLHHDKNATITFKQRDVELDVLNRVKRDAQGRVVVKERQMSKTLAIKPGFLTAQMAQPWQADFYVCARAQRSVADPEQSGPRIGWWPAQRPDDVIVKNPSLSVTSVVNTEFFGEIWEDDTGHSLDEGRYRLRITLTCLEPSGSPDPTKPGTVIVEGKTNAGVIKKTESLKAYHDVSLVLGFYFKTLIKIEIKVPKDWQKTNVSIGYHDEEMLDWARSIDNMYDNVTKWSGLGFVVGGVETERATAETMMIGRLR